MPELGRTVANAHLGNAFKNVIMVVIVNVPFNDDDDDDDDDYDYDYDGDDDADALCLQKAVEAILGVLPPEMQHGNPLWGKEPHGLQLPAGFTLQDILFA